MEKKEFVSKIMDVMFEASADRAEKSGMSQERIDLAKEKMQLLIEQNILEEELDSYTHNTYDGVAKILNEHEKKINAVLAETRDALKKYLDDNNLPYEEEEEEEEEEDVQSK